MIGDCQLDHPRSVVTRGPELLDLMGRSRCGNEPDRVQPSLFPATFGQQKMAVMDRIEAAAENTDAHGTLTHSHSPAAPARNLKL
jgi:hypothetical protein